MSHEYESGFVVREAAWHGLATVLQEPFHEMGSYEARPPCDKHLIHGACPFEVLSESDRNRVQNPPEIAFRDGFDSRPVYESLDPFARVRQPKPIALLANFRYPQ